MMEFHVSRASRDFYQFDQSLFTFNGNVIFANFHAARVFAQQINDKRDLLRNPEGAVQASQINAMGLIDEVLHLLFAEYRRQINPGVLAEAMGVLERQLGAEAVDKALRQFCEQFPPVAVYRREMTVDEYLAGETEGRSHREIALEEMMMLWLANMNPAFSPYLELFDDSDLEKYTAYLEIVDGLKTYFVDQPGFGPGGENLFDLLRAPALASPHSLSGQLEYIRTRWSAYLGSYLYRLLSSLDFIAEEEKASFTGPGPIEAIAFTGQEFEPERYSSDLDWMPRVVLLAKNAYVWLDQLSKQYERSITTLDQVPDEELDTLARYGITGLWLIGLWERSKASRRIKQMMGNPEAVASAYSLYDYEIAADLGGVEAMADLRKRCWERGIRMASDMVPNHMAIDSRWVIQHPNWFLSLDHSPFPTYTFNGPDLCDDERVGVYLEDHYYDHSDAAVVFKRVDHWTGDTRYIYHGNDGTSMPWNDTAQLDYLKAEVREAVIQTILHVARQFPIIRFDAAMTLAKRHIQRLWYPEPGSGGAIASRAEHGLTKETFDAAMPEEFWREVVDRVAAEAPDTLLLAEAFWLMEGYFVRTLGMHRVYNSAFMHMLRDEDNAKYRQLIKNTLEFDPEILKRYVNFMSNPDEETAVAQFGKDDKYFGVCTIMATVPGLPMFGHGQFEGYAEKYGMEYRKAYWDEQPDQWLIDRHLREITPLLHRRYLFADVQNFLLYDFFRPDGGVDENVIAYSNRIGGERSLVIYHNRFADTRGWLRTSAAYLDKVSGVLVQKNLGDGLDLADDPAAFVIFRDIVSGMEYIRDTATLRTEGLYVELGAYQRHVFVDFREVQEDEWGQYKQLHDYLVGRGVPSIDEAIKEILLAPLLQAFRELLTADTLQFLLDARVFELPRSGEAIWGGEQQERLDEIEAQVEKLLIQVRHFGLEDSLSDDETEAELLADAPGPEEVADQIREELETALQLPVLTARYLPAGEDAEDAESSAFAEAMVYVSDGLDDDPGGWTGLFAWVFSHALARVIGSEDMAAQSRSWMDEWLLGKLVQESMMEMGLDEEAAWKATALTKLLISHQDRLSAAQIEIERAADPESNLAYLLLSSLLRDTEVRYLLQVNRYGGVLWYNKEAFETLLHGMFTIAVVTQAFAADAQPDDIARAVVDLYEIVLTLQEAADSSEYQIDKLLKNARSLAR